MPHEVATLMLVRHAEQKPEFDRADLQTLVERQFVELDSIASADVQPRVTDRGHELLARFHTFR